MMDKTTRELVREVTGVDEEFDGAFNIRGNSRCVGRHSTENVEIRPTEGKDGIEIHIQPGTKETVYIPACISVSGVKDVVYNDFFIGEDADVTIVAGCAVHTDGDDRSEHNGIHRFFLGKNSKVMYKEKHIGTAIKDGKVYINPVTYFELGEGSYMEMDTSQVEGVDFTDRKTEGKIGRNARLVVNENLLTSRNEEAYTDYYVELLGEDSSVHLKSKSVAMDNSYQKYNSLIEGKAKSRGHSECDAIIVGNGRVDASPDLNVYNPDSQLLHEAAIGKIAGEKITKLQTLGYNEEEAEAEIIKAFLS